MTFTFDGGHESRYELKLGSVKGNRYRVTEETASVWFRGDHSTMASDGERVRWVDRFHGHEDPSPRSGSSVVAPGQSALSIGGTAGYRVFGALQRMRTVEVNPSQVVDLQEPSSTQELESDGSNVVSVYEDLSVEDERALVDELAAIVPGIVSIEVTRLSDRQTLRSKQGTESGNREFYPKQTSDGTLRAPESDRAQVVITTHSADIVDALPIEALRVAWSEGDASQVAPISERSKEPARLGLITPGELLRSDALDPATWWSQHRVLRTSGSWSRVQVT